MVLNTRRLLTLTLASSLALAVMPGIAAALEVRGLTREGVQLQQRLDSMHVERLWLPGSRVAWKTGKPLGGPVTDGKPHTHCSAFVAASCQRLNIYILSPPEHSTVMLANAQYNWLSSEGQQAGWKPVGSPIEAQSLANQGLLVVATYREDHKAGHIAIVRPVDKSAAAIGQEGPQIIQAGRTNYQSASLAEGFRNHQAAWRDQQVRFYSHAVAND